ncbi:MAG TPA: hypothetical protein VHW02_10105 [Rhizomicrobium sp.]|jgi:hypothetical protein|nr:hypothetical protein [Rhizomicrobium sp.]
MGILGNLLGLGGSALTGGLFGLAGNIATKAFTYLEHKQAFVQKQAEWTHESDLLRLQSRAATPETEHEPDIAIENWPALNASLASEAAIGGSYAWVNAVRALVRPALTAGLAAFLGYACLAPLLTSGQRGDVIDSMVFAATTAIVWWFGDRAPRRPK